MSSQGGHNLTGVWDGVYSYPSGGGSVSFVATLLEAGSYLGGTVHEEIPERGSALIFSSLSGHREEQAVTFRKTYDRGSGPEFGTVDYRGILDSDGLRIEGDWTIPGYFSGRFVMTRPRPEEVATRREVAETV